ncbi:MAG: hypothetical protein ACLUDH_15035 [Faecalispora sporosphaeroides]|uniref:hypothetical protein n=1 Tax=Faecalispora sporosphaeroides TaxID=1549 RepID=UPI0039933335
MSPPHQSSTLPSFAFTSTGTGHTPGHTSLCLLVFQTLITGDAIALEHGAPVITNPQYTLGMPRARESIQKLLEYGAKELICCHGGRWIPA